MLKSQVPAKQSLLIRAVAAIAYIACILQWFWALVLYLPLIQQSNIMELFITDPNTMREPIQSNPTEPSVWMFVLIIVITLAVIALTIYALVKTPGAIRKTGDKITHTTAKKYIVPTIVRKKKIPQKQLRVLTLKVEFLIKLALVIAPFAASMLAYVSPLPFDYRVIAASSATLASASFVFFTLEFVLKIYRRSSKKY